MKTKLRIAIQGVKGAYHHLAACRFFGEEIDLVESLSFSGIPELLLGLKADGALMAIENSIAGSILPNYALIDEYDLSIQGEVFLSIHHHLLALPGQHMSDIKEIWSHPMALLQCRRFLKKYPNIRLIEDTDTAGAAKKISTQQIKGVAAIAGSLASRIYGLQVIMSEIQTIKNNATRFFVLKNGGDDLTDRKDIDKASLKFVTKHHSGSLAKVLDIFAKYRINMTKIQSLPIIEEPWKYAFFVDLVFDTYAQYASSLKEIEQITSKCKVLGEYKKNN